MFKINKKDTRKMLQCLRCTGVVITNQPYHIPHIMYRNSNPGSTKSCPEKFREKSGCF